MSSNYRLKKERFYHLPHNAVRVDEFNFLVSKLDIDKRIYKAKELQRLFLIEEVTSDNFKLFHNKPYRNFIEVVPPDKNSLQKKFEELYRTDRCPRNTIQSVYNKIRELKPDRALEWFINQRRNAYIRFLRDPENNYDDFIKTPYTSQKEWKYNWAEFVRDYIQFMSYIGIIPAYYKGWGKRNQISGDVGFIITKLGEKYINSEISIHKLLMKYKYRNALINLDLYPQYSRKVRPFFATLKLLTLLKKRGVPYIEQHLLAGFISTIMEEDEVNYIVKLYGKRLNGNLNLILTDIFKINDRFKEEIGRFRLTLIKFLSETGLVTKKSIGRYTYISISNIGEQTYLEEPKQLVVSNEVIGNLVLTPVVGYLLKYFSDNVSYGKMIISIDELYKSSKSVNSLLTSDEFSDLLNDISRIPQSPINNITNKLINLNTIDFQYCINSSSDFSNLFESNFVEGITTIIKQEVIRIEKSKELESTIRNLESASLSSDGKKYEDELSKAIELLVGKQYVYPLGNIGATGQRLSDIVWKVPIIYDNQEKELLIIFECKAGNAINSFDERKEKDNLLRTIKHFSRDLINIAGIWYIIVDGLRCPESGHGGFRGGESLSFPEKLMDIHHTTLLNLNKLVLISAMNINSFIEYYKYLYQITRQFGKVFSNFNNIVIQNFWVWGNLFHPVRKYYNIYNDHTYVKNILRTTDA